MTAGVISPNNMRAGRLVRPARLSLCILALTSVAFSNTPVQAQLAAPETELSRAQASQSLADFYRARAGEPLWLRADGSSGEAANVLLDYLRTSDADGLDPDRYRTVRLAKALRAAWGGAPDAVRKADRMLSEAFVTYVRDLRTSPNVEIVWVDGALEPGAPRPRQLLESAAASPSLERWLRDMAFMHPIYAGLRQAIVARRGDPQILRLNLERARVLPPASGRHILVNATEQRLSMYENGKVVDSMRVVVGKPKNPTPMMAALVRFASLNPYWYVPPDLTAERIAPNVLREGLSYLKAHGYQVLTNWHDDSTIIDPGTIDWQAVADGTKKVWVRQLPGPGNSMGQMKFMFPNSEGIYLHDTPQKELLEEASRMFSGGCVRLEDAPRLARWMFGRPLKADSSQPEQRVDLPKPVPVFITYLTVMPRGTELATYPDVYGRDREELASQGPGVMAAR